MILQVLFKQKASVFVSACVHVCVTGGWQIHKINIQ